MGRDILILGSLAALRKISCALAIHFQRFVHRGYGRLAGTASTGVGQMFRGNAIFSPANFTGTNHRHKKVSALQS